MIGQDEVFGSYHAPGVGYARLNKNSHYFRLGQLDNVRATLADHANTTIRAKKMGAR